MTQQQQFKRKWSLVVAGSGLSTAATDAGGASSSVTRGLNLSPMRIQFHTVQSDVQTPNHATIRIFNLSDKTAKSIQKEFTQVTLQAGYINGPYGIIFNGDIKQVRRGRINATDTYLDILAGDGDQAYNQTVMNETIAPGATNSDKLKRIQDAMGVPQGYQPDLPPGALSRGKVMFGMARDYMRDLGKTTNTAWSIQGGKLQMIPVESYKPGPPIVLNAQTGMIGLPEQTEGGILVKALLNPNIQIGSLLQINNSSIQRSFLGGTNLFLNQGDLQKVADSILPKVTDDGFYRVYIAEYEGDTRGNPWYVDLTCLSVDKSAPADASVARSATE